MIWNVLGMEFGLKYNFKQLEVGNRLQVHTMLLILDAP